jgi:hypothetical protein
MSTPDLPLPPRPPQGPAHQNLRSLLRFTFRKRAAACARESATALPWAHCSAFCQDVPREVNPIVHATSPASNCVSLPNRNPISGSIRFAAFCIRSL